MYQTMSIKVLCGLLTAYATCTQKGHDLRGHGAPMGRLKGLWNALADVDDSTLREELTLVAVAIQVQFAGRIVRERSVVEFMAARFGWSGSRTRRRLDDLVSLGVLRCGRDLADRWTKVFEIVDRPLVPAEAAVEMGA